MHGLSPALVAENALGIPHRRARFQRSITFRFRPDGSVSQNPKTPAREASAIYLHYYENLPAREIAKILKCREGTVYSLLSRGRSHLKTILEAET